MSDLLLSRDVYFNSNDLGAIENFAITDVRVEGVANRTLYDAKIANADKSVVSGANWHSKRIEIIGVISNTDKSGMETTIGTILSKCQELNKVLQLPYGGETKQFTASYETIEVRNPVGGFAEIGITFLATDPFAYDTTYTTVVTSNNLTTNNQSFGLTISEGFVQLPVITITIDSVTGSTADLYFSNLTNDENITINRTWTANEVLVIDSENMTVKVDGVEVDYSGYIPFLSNGYNSLWYSDEFTTRQVDISVKYRKRRL